MNLTEIFDTTANVQWKKQNTFELARFYVNQIPYVIQIEQKPLVRVKELKGKRTAEVSFYVDTKDPNAAHSTTKEAGRAALSIYSVVLNALTQKFKEYDAFYFVAYPEHSINIGELEKKSDLYIAMANKVARGNNVKVYSERTKRGNAFLVSKIPIGDEHFINEADECKKFFDEHPEMVPKLNRIKQ